MKVLPHKLLTMYHQRLGVSPGLSLVFVQEVLEHRHRALKRMPGLNSKGTTISTPRITNNPTYPRSAKPRMGEVHSVVGG